jgi:cytochrome d ubiquinol oxidase subunit II
VLAAVFLAADAARDEEPELVVSFTKRALFTGGVLGAVALAGIVVLETDAVTLADGLERWGAPLVVLSAVGGIGAMWFLRKGRAEAARIPATLAVVAIVIGWGVGQYPWMLVDQIEIADAAGADSTLWALIVAFVIAGATAVPALIWMLRLTNSGDLSTNDVHPESSLARLRELSR